MRHRYGIVFYNDEIDVEICVYVEATSYWQACDLFDIYDVLEYEKGEVVWLSKNDYEYYPIKLEDLHKHCIIHTTEGLL